MDLALLMDPPAVRFVFFLKQNKLCLYESEGSTTLFEFRRIGHRNPIVFAAVSRKTISSVEEKHQTQV